MNFEDLVILGAVGFGVYTVVNKRQAPAGGAQPFQFQVPQQPNTFNPVPGSSSVLTSGYQAGAALIGDALSLATGIPGFGEAASKIAGLFGQGRRQADDLVQHYQNPLLDQVVVLFDQWHVALNTGRATAQVAQQFKGLLLQIEANFDAVASQPRFNRAGPGGIETVRHVMHDIWLPTVDVDYQRQGVP